MFRRLKAEKLQRTLCAKPVTKQPVLEQTQFSNFQLGTVFAIRFINEINKEKIMKSLSIYRPHTIQNALSDFDRYFESFFGDNILPAAAKVFNHIPAVDVKETENAYILDMELPGYDENNIEVNVDGSSLSISSKQEVQTDNKDDQNKGTYILRERRLNRFSRSFKLPENADPEAVSASFKNGILGLEIKKRAEAQKRSIQIKAG